LKIIVLGSRGFLGSHICQTLKISGHELSTLSYRPEQDNDFKCHLDSAVKSFDPDVIINAGASQNGKDDPAALNDLSLSNILLPSYLAWAINNYAPKCVLITFGSSWQHFNNEQLPFNAYAATKTAAEAMLEHYAQDGLRAACLQLYDTYGPNDERNKLVNLIADALIRREVLNMSGGEQKIDLIHIDDVVSAVVSVMGMLREHDSGCLMKYAIRSGKPVSIVRLVNIMAEARNLDAAEIFNLGFYPYRKRERFELNSSEAIVPGWEPRIKLVNGLVELISTREKNIYEKE
jgi:CDP-paratose synthetase